MVFGHPHVQLPKEGIFELQSEAQRNITQKGKVMLIGKDIQIHNCMKKAIGSAYLFSHSAAYYRREDKICFLNRQSQNKFLFLLHNRCYLETQKYTNS